MRIVMLGAFGLHPKGTMRARALPAARALAARGHAVVVLMPPWHAPEEGGRAWVDASGVHLEHLRLGPFLPLVGHAAATARMVRRAVALEPDVVHVFKPKAYAGLAGALLRAMPLAHRPRVVVDADDWEGPGGWNDREPYGRLTRAAFARQERWALGHSDAITAASRALETLAWAHGAARDRVIYLPNALDDWNGAVSGSGAPGGIQGAPGGGHGAREGGHGAPGGGHGAREGGHRPTLLLYTRFAEYDLDRPLDVLERVRRTVPDVRLVVVGRGLSGEERTFAERAGSRGLAGAVEDRGWLEPADAAAVMAESDVALYPFDDTLIDRTKSPVKLLELMAAGLPVVADAVGEPAEVIEDGRSGCLVPPGDVDGMADAVVRLLGDAGLRGTVGAGAARRVADRYRWSRRVEDLETAYRVAALPSPGGVRGARSAR